MSDTEQPNIALKQSLETKQPPMVNRDSVPYCSDSYCPNCGAPLVEEKCKVVCRSHVCVYRIVFNCSEF